MALRCAEERPAGVGRGTVGSAVKAVVEQEEVDVLEAELRENAGHAGEQYVRGVAHRGGRLVRLHADRQRITRAGRAQVAGGAQGVYIGHVVAQVHRAA